MWLGMTVSFRMDLCSMQVTHIENVHNKEQQEDHIILKCSASDEGMFCYGGGN
jgi:hypothetical protein